MESIDCENCFLLFDELKSKEKELNLLKSYLEKQKLFNKEQQVIYEESDLESSILIDNLRKENLLFKSQIKNLDRKMTEQQSNQVEMNRFNCKDVALFYYEKAFKKEITPDAAFGLLGEQARRALEEENNKIVQLEEKVKNATTKIKELEYELQTTTDDCRNLRQRLNNDLPEESEQIKKIKQVIKDQYDIIEKNNYEKVIFIEKLVELTDKILVQLRIKPLPVNRVEGQHNYEKAIHMNLKQKLLLILDTLTNSVSKPKLRSKK